MNRQCKKPSRRNILLALATLFLCIFGILFVKGCKKKPVPRASSPCQHGQDGRATKAVLRSSLAGKWYAGDAETLSKQIEVFFQKAEIKPISNVIALILPHAGYDFSGQTAVCGLKTTDKKYKRIVVIGPSHNPYLFMEEVLSVPRVTHYETLLGQIPLDVEFVEKLLKYSAFQNIPRAHKYEHGVQEHSVQIELPLLQHCQKDFKLVPIVAGSCSLETIGKAGAILKGLIDKETLVIASSDFVHYGPRFRYVPFTENVPEQIRKLDMGAYEHIARLDSKGFLEYKEKTGATICGYVPIAILLSMLDKPAAPTRVGRRGGRPAEAELIKYITSGELTGDFSNSVSYLSVAFSGKWQNCPLIEPQHSNAELTEEDKKQLLTLARESIIYALEKRRVPQASDLNVTISDAMKDPRAAFVTLKKNSQLRGCIGDIFPQRPLYKSALYNAIYAGFRDKRFIPVTKDELDDIVIEISALTPPQPVASYNEIRIGIDGVVLNKDGRSAVFLPQVAAEQGWDINQMLTRLSLKAKLPGDAWKKGANFLVFQAVVFGEEER